MLIPENTALADFGNPEPGIGNQDEAQMVVATNGRGEGGGAADRRGGTARRPEPAGRDIPAQPAEPAEPDQRRPDRIVPDPRLISLLIGAVGIANTTLVAVLERTEEIGLRRAVGARPRHIAASSWRRAPRSGTLGGLIGTCLGVVTVVIFAAAKDWTAVLNPATPCPLR